MSTQTTLAQMAIQIANETHRTAATLKAQLRQIEERKTAIEAQLEAANLAHKRAFDYKPVLGSDFQCPRCWIIHEMHTRLSPIPSNTRDDLFRCDRCQQEITVPM